MGLLRWSLALDPGHTLEQYNCRTWTRQNGLPVNGITAIAQSRDGYIWLGTAKTLLRFDGVNFVAFDPMRTHGVRNGGVRGLVAARSGGVWVGLENSGFGLFDGTAFHFQNSPTDGGEFLNVHSLALDRAGTLWIGSTDGGARLPERGKYAVVLKNTSDTTYNTLGVYVDPDGGVWFCTVNEGIYGYRNGLFSRIPDPELNHVIAYCAARTRDRTMWVGTSVGLFSYDASWRRSGTFLVGQEVRALLVDRHGALWIGATDGVYRCRQGRLSGLHPDEGLVGGAVTALCEDREGSLWVGARKGLSLVTDVKFPTEPASDKPDVHEVYGVAPSRKGGVWIAQVSGVTYFDGTPKTISPASGLPSQVCKRVFEASNGDLYVVAGVRNLYVLSKGKVVGHHVAGRMFVGLAEDSGGVVVSDGGALFRVNRRTLEPYRFDGKPPPMYWILNLLTGRDGSLWVASVNGLFRIQKGKYRRWGQKDGLSTRAVLTLAEDGNGVVWMGLLSGIARLDHDGRVRTIDHTQGLFDDDIYAIVPDDLGNLWVNSGRGIFSVSRRSMADCADGRAPKVDCIAYDGRDSVIPTDMTSQERVGARTPDGRIWFPTALGVVVVDPSRIPVNRIVPPVHIQSVEANGAAYPRAADAVVPPGRGELQFEFAALSYVAPGRIRFRYRLDGYDTGWIRDATQRFAVYNNLRPGTYTFRVSAANPDGVWNPTGDSVTIRLQPHYYQSGWFFALVGVAVSSLFGGTYAWRMRRLQRRALELQENRARLEAEVERRTAELADANRALTHEVEVCARTEEELILRTQSLEREIEERKRMGEEVARVHRELLDASRQAGMAEVATGVLHNVGNVLNSINVSAAVVIERLQRSRIPNVARLGELLNRHAGDLAGFLTNDQRGRQIPAYLEALSTHLLDEQRAAVKELEALRKNVSHINEIVAMQQSYARVAGVTEKLPLTELVEDALRINAPALDRHGLTVVREYDAHPTILVERHKVMQILINLIRNAKYACDESGKPDKRLTMRITADGTHVRISVTDNGVGIVPENLTRIFGHGFTTRKKGHGFGLHSSALTAKELGGSLNAFSEGPGTGATFTLELPLTGAAEPETHPMIADGVAS